MMMKKKHAMERPKELTYTHTHTQSDRRTDSHATHGHKNRET